MKTTEELKVTASMYWRHVEPILRAHGFDYDTCQHAWYEYRDGFIDGYGGVSFAQPELEALGYGRTYELAHARGAEQAVEDKEESMDKFWAITVERGYAEKLEALLVKRFGAHGGYIGGEPPSSPDELLSIYIPKNREVEFLTLIDKEYPVVWVQDFDLDNNLSWD